MSLPDARRLAELPVERWRELGRRLVAIGATHETIAALTGSLDAVSPEQRRALRHHHLWRAVTPAADALRLLFFDDVITEGEAREALGGDLLDELLSVGFVERRGEGGIGSPFVLALHGAMYVVADDLALGDGAVAGPDQRELTLSRASIPTAKVPRALSIACGSAANALALTQQATQVIAIDPDPRAIALARISAALNGLDSLELLVGEGLGTVGAVADRLFDVIVARLPLGTRDAPPWLAEATSLLAPGGICVLFADWAEVDGEPLAERLRAPISSKLIDLLVLRAPPTAIDAHVAAHVHARHRAIDESYARAVVALRETFASQRISAVRTALVVLRRSAPDRTGWTATLEVRPYASLLPSRLRIDRLLAGRDLLESPGDERLLASALRFPKRTTFHATRTTPDPEATPTLQAHFSERALVRSFDLDPSSFMLLSLVHISETLGHAARFTADTWSIPVEEARQQLLRCAKDALGHGGLEIAAS